MCRTIRSVAAVSIERISSGPGSGGHLDGGLIGCRSRLVPQIYAIITRRVICPLLSQ